MTPRRSIETPVGDISPWPSPRSKKPDERKAESIYDKLTAELETSPDDDRASNERYRAELAELLGIE